MLHFDMCMMANFPLLHKISGIFNSVFIIYSFVFEMAIRCDTNSLQKGKYVWHLVSLSLQIYDFCLFELFKCQSKHNNNRENNVSLLKRCSFLQRLD